MSKALSAPIWLETMPTEILRKMVDFTIPSNFDINVSNMFHSDPRRENRKMTSVSWSPEWVPEVRLVSRRVRKVVEIAMVEHCGFHFTMGDPDVRKTMALYADKRIRLEMLEWLKAQEELPLQERQGSLGVVVNKAIPKWAEYRSMAVVLRELIQDGTYFGTKRRCDSEDSE
ncbi:uncharacterized protein AB675_3032 [Cyphellophora attinorum]|uniref:F-box domain-containing protein n=1 Tax=Cyphellophora attinorum TaxID=1664694 RepID=A0A0N1NY10_9EURO|nr:uncharacterized protein AB675_3032 [Phialophora attinorum]KPI37915.1 hypothetical protein AB675_3032 [Phialophora attinorum]